MKILRKYWPWLVPIGFLLVYELIALLGPAPTLSALVWEANAVAGWLDYTVVIIAVVLLYHFFLQKRGK
jgi:hypothetical protein